MPKTEFEHYLCRYHCAYYRAGVREELTCQGALVVDNLVRRGRLRIAELPDGAFPAPPAARLPLLDERICRPCEFRAADCDFQARPPIPDSLPCGGYRLLAMLLRNRRLTADDLPRPADA